MGPARLITMSDLTISIRQDPQVERQARRIRELEYTLDDALAALDTGASLRQREDARQAIRSALIGRRTLKGQRRAKSAVA